MGRARDDGADLRLVNAAGEAVPFRVLKHDSDVSTLIQYHVPDEKSVYVWLYYGNPNAKPVADAAGKPEGVAFVGDISDGLNRFGPSDHYISRYEGWLRVDKPGRYGFRVFADDGAWVKINDIQTLDGPKHCCGSWPRTRRRMCSVRRNSCLRG